MKKLFLFILAFAIAIALVILISNNTKTNVTQSGDVNNVKNDIEYLVKNHTEEELTDMIKAFFNDFSGLNVTNIKYGRDENNNVTADAYFSGDLFAKLVFDDDTGYALDNTTGLTVDFENGKFTNQLKDRKSLFEDKYSLVIAYIPNEENEGEIADKYFRNKASFDVLERYDLRSSYDPEEFESKFMLVPNDDVSIALYDCYINDEGQLITNHKLVEGIQDPIFLYYANYESTMPQFIVEYKSETFSEQFPLVFSGMDGKIDLSGQESRVKDVSIYQ